MNSILDQLKIICEHQYTSNINPSQIFAFISNNNQNSFILWEKSLSSQASATCQKSISNGEQAYICMTCCLNPTNQICQSCFDPALHQDHLCFTSKDGACHCGNSKKIRQEGHCKNHQSVTQEILQQNQEPIPQELQQCISNFVIGASKLYCEFMKQISNQWQKFSQPIMQLYHICNKLNLTKITKLFDQKIQYGNFYKLLLQSSFIHKVLFSFIDWLTNGRQIFQSLIAKILQQKLSDQQKTIYEEVMQYQVLYETTSPESPFNIEYLIIRLNSDKDFFQFVYKKILEMFEKFYIFGYTYSMKSQGQIYEFLDALEEVVKSNDTDFLKKNKQFVNQLEKAVEVYIQDLKKAQISEYAYLCSESLNWWFEGTDDQSLKLFIDNVNSSNAIEFLKTFYDKLHQPQGAYSSYSYPLQVIKAYNRKFRNYDFDELVMEQFKMVAGQNYEMYRNELIPTQQFDQFKYNEFILTQLINSFQEIKPAITKSQKNLIGMNNQEFQDSLDYLFIVGEIFAAVKTGFESLFSSKQSTDKFEINFINLVLKQTYQLIKNKRNTVSTFENDINQAFTNTITKDLVDEKTQFERERRVLGLLIKNATILDKIFIFLLALRFVKENYQSPQHYLQFLEKLFIDSQANIKHNLNQILKRCIQNYFNFWTALNDEVDKFYYGYGDDNLRIKLEAFDVAFVKFYLYFYGAQGLKDFHSAVNLLRISNEKFKSQPSNLLLLRVLTSDLDIYELTQKFFDNKKQQLLPPLLQQALQKVIQNIFSLKEQCTYDYIMSIFEQLGISSSESQKVNILEIVELDLETKQLKLKKQYLPIYDPIIFSPQPQLKQDVMKLYQTQNKPELFYLFGNGLLWDIQNLNQNVYGCLRKEIFNSVCQLEYIQETLQKQVDYKVDGQETFILDFYLLVAGDDLQKQQMKEKKAPILKQLKALSQLFNLSFTKILLNIFEQDNFISQFYGFVKPFHEQQLQNDQQTFANLEKVKLEKDDTICAKCSKKMELNQTQRPVLILRNHRPIEFNMVSQINLSNKQINLNQLDVQSCQHLFHSSCLSLSLASNQQQAIKLPSFLYQGCPVCNQSFNFSLSIIKELSNFGLQLMNKNLFDGILPLGLEQYFKDCYQNKQIDFLIDIQLEILVNLLNQLFMDTKNFISNNYSQIFNKIFYLLQLTIKQNGNSTIFKNIEIENNDENNFISKIVQIIFIYLIHQDNIQEFQKQITNIIQKISLKYNSQLVQQICDCFEIKMQVLEQQQFQSQQLNEIKIDQEFLLQNALNKIKKVLGNNFQEFHEIHQKRLKNYCNLIDIELYQEIHLCLLCQNYVFKKSNQIQNIENLEAHTIKEHSGASFYVCLNDGNCNMCLSQITSKEIFNLYFYQGLGYSLNKQRDSKWNQYILDQSKLQNIISTIINNSYVKFLRKHNQPQINIQPQNL